MTQKKYQLDTVGFEPRSTTDNSFKKQPVPVNGTIPPRHPQSWSGVWTSDMTAIMSFCLYYRDGVLAHEGFRGDASRPPDHIQPAPCTTLPRNRHIDLKDQKTLVYSVLCFHGYCCGNFLEPVVQWTKPWASKTLRQTRLGQVSTWMGDLDPLLAIVRLFVCLVFHYIAS